MQRYWFTADLHLGHKRILELANRPFSTVYEMDAAIILNWCNLVQPDDIVYVVGDFAFDEHDKYLVRLPGTKILVPGNHDYSKRVKKATGWHEVEEKLVILKDIDGRCITLCHYAMRTWYKSHHGALHLYGHSHGNLPGDTQSCDVGVDCWGFRPIILAEAEARMKSQAPRQELDHHKPNIKDDIEDA